MEASVVISVKYLAEEENMLGKTWRSVNDERFVL